MRSAAFCVICFGTLAVNGEIPADENMLGQMVRDICFNNAQRYFPLQKVNTTVKRIGLDRYGA